MTSVCWVLIGDGRDAYHRRSRRSLRANLPAPAHVVEIDDRRHELGFGGAIREAWAQALDTDCTHIWHGELDFTLNQPIPLQRMIEVLGTHPYLAQLALLRQPWNDAEKHAGSIFDLIRDELTPATDGVSDWLEHRRHWTTNPSVYPRWVAEIGWPDCDHSEGVFGGDLLRSAPELRSAYWGQGEEWCHHIGDQRTGTGY